MPLIMFLLNIFARIIGIIIVISIVLGILGGTLKGISTIFEWANQIFEKIHQECDNWFKKYKITPGGVLIMFILLLVGMGLIANILESIFGRNII